MHDDFSNLMTTLIISTIDVQWFIFFFSQREKKNILELLKKRHEAQEQLFKQKLKLEQDVKLEKLRKVNFIRLLWDMLKSDDQSGTKRGKKAVKLVAIAFDFDWLEKWCMWPSTVERYKMKIAFLTKESNWWFSVVIQLF